MFSVPTRRLGAYPKQPDGLNEENSYYERSEALPLCRPSSCRVWEHATFPNAQLSFRARVSNNGYYKGVLRGAVIVCRGSRNEYCIMRSARSLYIVQNMGSQGKKDSVAFSVLYMHDQKKRGPKGKSRWRVFKHKTGCIGKARQLSERPPTLGGSIVRWTIHGELVLGAFREPRV